MKTNEKLNVTNARMDRANAAPSDSAGEITPQTPNSGSEEFISKKELAWRLRVTVRTISNWQRRGLVPFVKCRRAIYYDWHGVAAHLRGRARVTQCKAREERVVRIPVIEMAEERKESSKFQVPKKFQVPTAKLKTGDTDKHGLTRTTTD